MSASSKIKQSRPQASASFDALEQTLRAQLDGHERLLRCVQRKREAIRMADIATVTAVCNEEATLLQKLRDAELRRMDQVQQIMNALQMPGGKSMTVTEIVAYAAEPQQSRLLALAAHLREVVAEVKRESSVVRAAAEALSRHMSGIAQTVQSALARAGIYGSRGRLTPGAPLQSFVDIRS